MEKKYLSFPFQLKEISKKEDDNGQYGIIKGYASTFGNIDRGRDRVMKGAFTKTLKKYKENNRQIRMFFQHDKKMVIGGFNVFQETEQGLYVEGKINLEVQKGKETYALAKQGVITDFSIGYGVRDYEIVKEKVTTDNGDEMEVSVWNLKELELFEISPVTNPMNEAAVITSIKSCKSITDASNILKNLGLSNKETNELIYFIKNSSRNDDENKNNSETRNDDFTELDNLILSSKLDTVISKIKKGI